MKFAALKFAPSHGFGTFWDDAGIVRGSFGDRFGMVLVWFGMVLVPFCYGFTMVLVWFWDVSGAIPGSFRDRSGSILGWFGDGFKLFWVGFLRGSGGSKTNNKILKVS